MPAEDVVNLREREPEAFVLFRKALSGAIDDVKSAGALTPSEARSIYGDVIAPGLAKLDQTIKTARKNTLKKIGDRAFGWTAAISFGMYAGLLPDQLKVAAIALGLVKVGAEAIGSIAGTRSLDSMIRNENLFFLWKVRELSRRRWRVAAGAT